MAYDASSNEQDQQQVAGAAPLSQGEATPMSEQSQGGSAPSQPSGSSTIQSSGGSTPKKKTASSGMFKNIQKYVEKNQPQAQKMAGAATEDFGKKASEIREATEQKQAQQSQALQANTKAMSEQKDWAQQQVGQAMGTAQAPAPVQGTQAPSAEDNASKFQDLMKGNVEGVNNVQDLNLTQQKMKSDALQRLAQGTKSEQGRRNLLKETFQDKGNYNRGMSGLDQLIVSGDQGARESMIGGTQDRARALQDIIAGTSQSSREALTEQQRQLGGFGGQIGSLAQTEADKFSGLGEDITGLKATDAEIQGLSISDDDKARLAQGPIEIENQLNSLNSAKQAAENYKIERERTAAVDGLDLGGQTMDEYLQRDARYQNLMGAVQDQESLYNNAVTSNEALQSEINSKTEQERALMESGYLENLEGTQADIAKFNALQQLMGKENSYDIQDMLDRYKVNPGDLDVKSGGTRK